MTAAEPELTGEEEDLDVFQPRRSPHAEPGLAGFFGEPRTARSGPTVPVGTRTRHKRARCRSRARRATLEKAAEGARARFRTGLRSLGPMRARWRARSIPEPPRPRTLAASAVLTVVVLLAFAVVRDSSLTDNGEDIAAGVADRSGTLPALPGLPPESSTPAPNSALSTSKMKPISEQIRVADSGGPSARPSAPARHKGGGSSKEPSGGSSKGGGSTSSESGSHSGSRSGTRDSNAIRWSMRSVNYPDRYWRVRSGVGYLDQVGASSSVGAREDASFTVVRGLADSSCYSFIADDGRYLRHKDFRLQLSSDDGSRLFRQDATFCLRSGAYQGTVSFESYNYPGRFLRHRNFSLYLDSYQNTTLYANDSSFRVVSALY